MRTSDAIPAGPLAAASSAIAAGGLVIVATGYGEGNLVCAAGSATTDLIAFMVRHTSGFLAVAVPELECERMALTPMHARGSQHSGLDHRVTVDAASGISTGISARDRAHTARLLADPGSDAMTFTRPGHVVPIAARAGGVLVRPGEAEAGVDLAALAGVSPTAVMARIVSPTCPERMADDQELAQFGRDHRLPMVSPADIAAHAGPGRTRVVRAAVTPTPTAAGPGHAIGYLGTDGAEHLVLVAGSVSGRNAVPTYVHHECLLGDVFGAPRCSCRRRLDRARRVITERGGVLIYLRPAHGGLRASHPCPRRARTAGREHACADDADPGVPGQILRDLGVRSAAPLFGALRADPVFGPHESTIPTGEVA
jgi:3,4-dihydroxy 2-butanone 4-phosphate synthase/GTP cyclohydrolase II